MRQILCGMVLVLTCGSANASSFTPLGDLAGGGFSSIASGISADGSVVVGRGRSASGTEAFIWTGGVMTGLGDLAGGIFDSSANGVSADGSVVVGQGTTASGSEAFIWTAGGGMERLLDVLLAGGATGLTGWTSLEATAISADGQWISGYGTNSQGQTEAFLADISPGIPDAVDDGPFAAPEGVAKIIPVGANDTSFSNPVTVTVLTPPTKGTITAISPPGPRAGMTITYTANIGESGADSFVYEMTDGTPSADSATVTLNIGPDADGDDVLDASDNCTAVANPSQCDSDADGFGNRCDGDLNNNTVTNSQDVVLFRDQLTKPSVAPIYNEADLNCNGAVNSQDYVLLRQLLARPPGPSGLVP